MKNRSIVLLLLIIFLSSMQNSMPQNWMRVDSVFNPSGVYALSFSCPAFADMDADGKTDLFVGNSNKAQYFKNTSSGGINTFSFDESMLASIYTTSIGVNNYYPLTAILIMTGILTLSSAATMALYITKIPVRHRPLSGQKLTPSFRQ